MASPVRALSNHYETLEVPPTATTDEIVQAFASHMRTARMRPDITVARLARLSVAYETLRDPAKRRTYDASIGLTREPPAVRPNPSPFIGAPVIARLNRIAEPSPDPPLRQQAPLARDVRPEPRVAAFIAASLRDQAGSSDRAEPAPSARIELPRPIERAAEAPFDPAAERLEIEDGRLSVGRTGATLTAGVIGIAILAFAVALPERNPDRLSAHGIEAEPGLTVPVPPPTTTRNSAVAPQPLATTAASASASPRLQTRSEPSATGRKPRSDQGLAVSGEQSPRAASEQLEAQSLPTEIAAKQLSEASPAAETPAAAATSAPVNTPVVAAATAAAAALPLPNATIARTIERIGYGCGRVVSAAGVEGAAGVFTITCSSGDTYRASPVRGRYHFRRTDSH